MNFSVDRENSLSLETDRMTWSQLRQLYSHGSQAKPNTVELDFSFKKCYQRSSNGTGLLLVGRVTRIRKWR